MCMCVHTRVLSKRDGLRANDHLRIDLAQIRVERDIFVEESKSDAYNILVELAVDLVRTVRRVRERLRANVNSPRERKSAGCTRVILSFTMQEPDRDGEFNGSRMQLFLSRKLARLRVISFFYVSLSLPVAPLRHFTATRAAMRCV